MFGVACAVVKGWVSRPSKLMLSLLTDPRRLQTRSRIIDRLCSRRGLPEDGHELDEYTPECAQMLEEGYLRQVCVEMSFEAEPHSETKRLRKVLSHRNAQTSPTVPIGGRAAAGHSNET